MATRNVTNTLALFTLSIWVPKWHHPVPKSQEEQTVPTNHWPTPGSFFFVWRVFQLDLPWSVLSTFLGNDLHGWFVLCLFVLNPKKESRNLSSAWVLTRRLCELSALGIHHHLSNFTASLLPSRGCKVCLVKQEAWTPSLGGQIWEPTKTTYPCSVGPRKNLI